MKNILKIKCLSDSSKLFTISVIVLIYTSCSGGIKDRAGSIEGNSIADLTQNEVNALATKELEDELDYLQIDKKYEEAHLLINQLSFTNLESFHQVKCVDSVLQSQVNRFHAFSLIINNPNSQDHVISVLNTILERMKNEEKNEESSNRLKVLTTVIKKIEDHRVLLNELANKCANVKLKKTENPVDPIDDKEEYKEDPNTGG